MWRRCVLVFLMAAPGWAEGPPSQEQLAQAVKDLGADSFTQRENATMLLWSAGPAAEPLLRLALRSTDAEVVARATDLLDKIPFGIRPDSPRQLAAWISRARSADQAGWLDLVRELIDDNPRNVDLARSLAQKQSDPNRRRSMLRGIDREGWRAAWSFVRDGDWDRAGELWSRAAAWHGANDEGQIEVIRQFAIFTLAAGSTDRCIAEFAQRQDRRGGIDGFLPDESPDGSSAATVLAFLHLAKNDVASGRKLAEQSGRPGLIELADFEAGDWSKLADRVPSERVGDDAFALGWKMTLAHLAGRSDFAEVRQAFEKTAELRPSNRWLIFRTTLFDRRIDDAIALADRLRTPEATITHAEMLAQVGKLQEAMQRWNQLEPREKPTMMAQLALARLHFREGSQKQLVAGWSAMRNATNNTPMDLATVNSMVEFLVQRGRPEEAADQAAMLIGAPTKDPIPKLFPRATLAAPMWLAYFRATEADLDRRLMLRKILPLVDARLKAPERLAVWDAALKWAQGLPSADRSGRLVGLAEAAANAGLTDRAMRCIEDAACPDGWILAGDLAVEAGRSAEAAKFYQQAGDANRRYALPVVLAGWSLAKSGDVARGRELLRRARGMAVGDDSQRATLVDELARRAASHDGLSDEVRWHRAMIIHLAPLQSAEARTALARQSADLAALADPNAASQSLTRLLIRMVRSYSYFVDNEAYLRLLHRCLMWDALAKYGRGDWPACARMADEAASILPTSDELVSRLVARLEKDGKKSEADAIYSRVAGPLEQLVKAYPRSDQLAAHRASLALSCRRDVPRGLELARQAARLAPDETKHQELCAEAAFQSGDSAEAKRVLTRLLESEPRHSHWRRLLRRIEAGDPTVPVPAP